MSNVVELPLIAPIYSTYHRQGPGSAIVSENVSIRNWYLNQVMNLTCNRKFLTGFTTPEIDIQNSATLANPHIYRSGVSMQFAKGHIHTIIREMLSQGYYVLFGKIDDYYIAGKSWYMERHFAHDGLICGYDPNEKAYCVYAYDTNWVYRKFWTPQKGFEKGRKVMEDQGIYGSTCAIKPKPYVVDFSPETAIASIEEYLNSSLEIFPFNGDGDVFGIVVHMYMAEYLTKLEDGSIPYEKMDWRVFRLSWEHKRAMLWRIEAIEHTLCLDNKLSEAYKPLVAEADAIRMLYASHHMKRRDSLLPIIRRKLLMMMLKEKDILTILVEAMKTGCVG